MPLLRCRVLLVGDTLVGKSTIMHQLTDQAFQPLYLMTKGVDYKVKTIKIPDSSYSVEFHLLDIGGNEFFRETAVKLCTKANIVLFHYDSSKESTFTNIKYWTKLINDNLIGKSFKGYLLGNIFDKRTKVIAEDKGKGLAATYGMNFIPINAAQKQQVDDAFLEIAKSFYQKYKEKEAQLERLNN